MAYLSLPIRSSQTAYCYTCGFIYAGATYPCRAIRLHVVVHGTCEYFFANTLYLTNSPLFTLIFHFQFSITEFFRREICQFGILCKAQPLTANAGIQTGCFYECGDLLLAHR